MNKPSTTSQFPATDWIKSSYSAADNECVEVARVLTRVGIRDSKVSGRCGFTVNAHVFSTFIDGLKRDVIPR